MSTLTIAISTYRGETLLPSCIASLLQQDFTLPGIDWLVVHSDPTAPLVPATMRTVYTPPTGNIAALNVCFREAQGEYVLYVANDVRLYPRCLQALWEHRQGSGVVQPVLVQPDGQIDNVGLRWRWPGYGTRVRQVGQPIDAFAATCFMMPRELWELMEGFDESLGVSHEDIEMSLKLREHGLTVSYCREARATHLMGQTIGRVLGRPLSPLYHRARQRVIRKHYHGVDRWARLTSVAVLDALAAHRPRR